MIESHRGDINVGQHGVGWIIWRRVIIEYVKSRVVNPNSHLGSMRIDFAFPPSVFIRLLLFALDDEGG